MEWVWHLNKWEVCYNLISYTIIALVGTLCLPGWYYTSQSLQLSMTIDTFTFWWSAWKYGALQKLYSQKETSNSVLGWSFVSILYLRYIASAKLGSLQWLFRWLYKKNVKSLYCSENLCGYFKQQLLWKYPILELKLGSILWIS